MNNNLFNIDFNKLAQWMLIPKKRKPKTVALLLAFIKPVVTLYQDFLRYRKQKLYELKITGQVCYLEMLLNDKYDNTQRRIRIVDAIDKPPTYIFRRDELKPVYFYKRSENKPVYVFTRGEVGTIKDDFVVKVPSTITFNDNEMLTLLKGYRLPSIRPKIQRV